jgi:hypothetical protein
MQSAELHKTCWSDGLEKTYRNGKLAQAKNGVHRDPYLSGFALPGEMARVLVRAKNKQR